MSQDPLTGQYSEQAASINVRRDQYQNEVPVDKPNHENPTPGEGCWQWEGKQYSEDFQGGFGKYGVVLKDEDNRGLHPEAERIIVDIGRSNRGQES